MLHIVPLPALDPAVASEVFSHPMLRNGEIRPLGSSGWSKKVNFDGRLWYERPEQGKPCRTYMQVFRNGIMEAVLHLNPTPRPRKVLPTGSLEPELMRGLKEYLALQKVLSAGAPVFALVTILGCKDYEVGTGRDFGFEPHHIDRDALVLPETLVEDLGAEPATILRPTFDTIWQSAGWERDLNYDDEGRWNQR